jgi:hypothetical protein
MSNTFTEVMSPRDPAYLFKREKQLAELYKMSERQLIAQLRYLEQAPANRDPNNAMTKAFVGELMNDPYVPQTLKAGILDSTGGGTSGGSVLIRQDLEATLYALFVKRFPWYDRINKAQSNGLVHAWNQMTSPDNTNALGGTVIAELGSVTYTATAFARQTAPIAVLATGRGVGIKELAAVQAGGANYDPMQTELVNGATKLATDMQYLIMQGNATNAAGTAANEQGAYNTLSIDGFRGVLGSAGTFSANNAIQLDIGGLNITESVQTVAARSANNGGMPSAVVMSINAKQALDIENQGNRRYNDTMTEIIPGVKVNSIQYAQGQLDVIPVPGNMIGTYSRTSDSVTVEDIYVVDESTLNLRWLYSPGMTILQIPTGVDGILSNRYIIFLMAGLQVAAPVFNGKCRRIAS